MPSGGKPFLSSLENPMGDNLTHFRKGIISLLLIVLLIFSSYVIFDLKTEEGRRVIEASDLGERGTLVGLIPRTNSTFEIPVYSKEKPLRELALSLMDFENTEKIRVVYFPVEGESKENSYLAMGMTEFVARMSMTWSLVISLEKKEGEEKRVETEYGLNESVREMMFAKGVEEEIMRMFELNDTKLSSWDYFSIGIGRLGTPKRVLVVVLTPNVGGDERAIRVPRRGLVIVEAPTFEEAYWELYNLGIFVQDSFRRALRREGASYQRVS